MVEKESSSILKVIVNTREFEESLNDVVAELKKNNIPIETRKILSDYIVRDYLIFRFRVEDIVNLIRTRHLEEQLEKIKTLNSNTGLFNCIVIIELNHLNLHPTVRDTILRVFLDLLSSNIGVLISYSSSMTARLIELIFNDSFTHSYMVKKTKLPSDYTELTLALAMLQVIPGIGPKRAAKLLYEFGSILSIAQSSSEEISTRGEIPLSLARKLLKALTVNFNV